MTQATAIALVNQFQAETSQGVWPNVDRATFATDLIARIQSPDMIDQGGTPLCGPAATIRTLATDNPDGYAQAAISLFNTGTATIGSLSITASNGLRTAAIPSPGRTAGVDWVVLGSIRDSSNWFLSLGGLLGNSAAGITTSGAIESWLQQTGYTDIQSSIHYVMKPIFSVLAHEAQTASNLVGQGYHVMLLIDGDMLRADNQDDLVSMYPTHWIVLTSSITGIGGFNYDLPVSFDCYTWGGQRKVPQPGGPALSKHNFLHKYYGYVAAKL